MQDNLNDKKDWGKKTKMHIKNGICVLQCMEACQIHPFSHCGMFGGGGSGQFSANVWHTLKKKNRGKAIHLFVWELREYLTKQHSRGEWFLLPTPEAEQSRSAFTLHPSQRRGGCRLHSADDGNSHCFIHYETISNHNCNLQYMSKLQNNFYVPQ